MSLPRLTTPDRSQKCFEQPQLLAACLLASFAVVFCFPLVTSGFGHLTWPDLAEGSRGFLLGWAAGSPRTCSGTCSSRSPRPFGRFSSAVAMDSDGSAKSKRLWVKANGTILVGRCTTHFRTYISGDWDVHWGYDLDFDPWPSGPSQIFPGDRVHSTERGSSLIF